MRFFPTVWAVTLGTLLCRAQNLDLPSAPSVPPPEIAIQRADGRASLIFRGTLQSASTVNGAWVDLPAATSPLEIDLTSDQKFFRARKSGVLSIFGATDVVDLAFSGPLQAHFELAHAGQPDGIFPPIREKPYFEGTVKMDGFELPVSLRVRGNSSLQECPFPKLKFKVSKKDREGTPFFDAREIKIGTHCAEGGRGPIGRLRDETATYREALAYETMDLLGFIGPRVRRARIEYKDTTPTNGVSEVGWSVGRNAVILEDIEVVAERLGGRALKDEEITVLTNANFGEQLTLELRLLHALFGNWDYALATDGRGIWNTEVIQLGNGQLVPVASDFDLASWVTGTVRLSVPWDYLPELPDIDRQARYDIENLQRSTSAENFATAKERFMQRRAAIESRINTAWIDEPGRTNALRHIEAFFGGFPPVKP